MLQRNKVVLWRELAGEAVLLDPEVGCSYNLNRTGTLVWKMLDGQHRVQEIATELSKSYEVEYEQALRDVETVLDDLRQNNLLSHIPSSIR